MAKLRFLLIGVDCRMNTSRSFSTSSGPGMFQKNSQLILTDIFKTHLANKLRAKEATVDIAGEVKNFSAAETYARNEFGKKPITEFSSDEFISLIKEIHKRVAPSIYAKKQHTLPAGEFRADDSFVLRHRVKHATFNTCEEYGKIALFLENAPDHGKNTALHFLTGYYKKFIIPTQDKIWISKFQDGITKYYQKKFDSKAKLNPKEQLQKPLSPEENHAIELIYHFFLQPTDIKKSLELLIVDLIETLKKKFAPAEVFAKFYLEFINIHPFNDANSRTMKIFLNSILLQNGFQPIMLENSDSRIFTDYFYKKDPIVSDLVKYVESFIKPLESKGAYKASTEADEDSDIYIRYYHKLNGEEIQTIYFDDKKDEERVYLPKSMLSPS